MRTPRLHLGQYSRTFETSIGISFESRPPWGFLLLGRMCLYTRLTPSTTILFFVGKHAEHLGDPAIGGSSLVVAGDHFHLVVFTNMHGPLTCFTSTHIVGEILAAKDSSRWPALPVRRHTTSAARLMIFMNWRSRSSRAMAPKMRVPRGFFSLSIRTTALRSNRT